MNRVALIGGSGLDDLKGLEILTRHYPETPYGPPSAPILEGRINDHGVFFLARHGKDHRIPPHRINYRANIAALQQLEVTTILAAVAVGGITAAMAPGTLAIPDQIIDYTWGREHTFFDGQHLPVNHIDFSTPYSSELRARLIDAASDLAVQPTATYGATQGPRLETPAEITRMARDGCDIVGMTGMPEAALAAEAGIAYGCAALVVNWAAGRGTGPIEMHEIEAQLHQGMGKIVTLFTHVLRKIP